MNDTTKKILILAAVFAAIFLIAKRQGDNQKKDGFIVPGLVGGNTFPEDTFGFREWKETHGLKY